MLFFYIDWPGRTIWLSCGGAQRHNGGWLPFENTQDTWKSVIREQKEEGNCIHPARYFGFI